MNFSQNFVVYGIRSNNFQQYPPRNIVTTRLTNQRNQTKNVRDQIEIWFQFLLFSCNFWQKVGQIKDWSSFPSGLTPPLGNPGSSTDLNILKSCIITGRNEVVAKVIFLHLSVILFTGGVLPQCMLGYQPPLSGSRHPPRTRHHPRGGGEADSSIQSTSGRYASYWNAFLFINRFSSLSFQAVEAGFNTTEDFWVVINEDLCLTCIIDQSSWLNARLLAVNLQIPNPDSRGCAPIDASLFRRLSTGMTVKKAVVTCSVIAKLLIASVELIYLCIVDQWCSTETLRCSRFFTIITPKI